MEKPVLFLVSGASGVGKSTVRELVSPMLGTDFEAVELRDLGSLENVTVELRQQLAEVAAQRAAHLAGRGRHLLLSGDPVAPAEIIASPSATEIGGIAACILDADAATQARRLAERGDPPEYLPLHIGFADWMREHAADPLPRLDVVSSEGSNLMRWERFSFLRPSDPRWKVHVIDTTHRSRKEVAGTVIDWIRRGLHDERLVMRPEFWVPDETAR